MMVSAAALLAASSAWAGDQLLLAPAQAWVRSAEVAAPQASEATQVGYRYRLYDAQTRFEDGIRHSYVRYRILLTSPEGVNEGGVIALDWSADHEDLTVHHVQVVRQGVVIEVLEAQKFEILRRETGFETSMVMGLLTAGLHPADLRVGDELDVAFTVSRKEPVVGALPETLISGSLNSPVEQLRVAASWPNNLNMRMKAMPGWTVPAPRRRGGFTEITVDMKDVEPYFVPTDAPRRFYVVRELELSSYDSWGDLVGLMTPHYDRAASLAPESPLHAEIARIRAAHPTQKGQALAALRLVEDQVRYLAVLMGEGGWVPTGADEVWRLRQGDCKGKTVVLLALLRGLGISANAALVSTTDGDSLAEGLPRLHAFDHVLVRTELDGEAYWLDGTRAGDRVLERSAFAPYRQALVLADGRTGLDTIPVIPQTTAASEMVEIVDASAGLFAPANLTLKTIIRGDAGRQVAAAMQDMGPVARQQRLDKAREDLGEQLKEAAVTAGYDEEQAAYVVVISGRMEGLLAYGAMTPTSLKFSPPELSKRTTPFLPDAPHVVGYPSAMAGRMEYRLPEGARYNIYGGNLNFEAVGIRYDRQTSIEEGRITGSATSATTAYEVPHEIYEKARLAVDPRFRQDAIITISGVYQPTSADRAAWAAAEAESDATKRAVSFEARIRELAALGLYDEAESTADRAVETTGEQSGVWAARADLRITRGNFDGAEADLDQAETLDPANTSVSYGRIRLATGRGDPRESILAYTRLLRVNPTDVRVLQARAFAYFSAGLPDRALADMDAALKAASDDAKPQAKARKVVLLGLMGRVDEAENLSVAVMEEAPDQVSLLASRIDWLLEQKRGSEAADLVRKLQQRDPGEVESATHAMVTALAAGGDEEGALAAARAFIASNPDHPDVLNGGCWMLAVAGVGLDQAEAWCDAGLAARPLSGAIADSRGRLRLQQGRHEAALADFDYALSRQAVMSPARYGRGLALLALGREEEGRADLELARRQNPDVLSDFRAYSGAR
ncbi:Beta-barrel assembly-enhancing protease [compost metagenome]